MQDIIHYIQKNRTARQEPLVIDSQFNGEMYSNTRPLYYRVRSQGTDKKVFAFLSVPFCPMPEGGYPAVLLIHGGCGSAFYEMSRMWSERGFVTIAPDFHAQHALDTNVRNLHNEDGGPLGYGSFEDLYTDEPWVYFSVLSAMSAIDVLESLDCVNKDKICSCGLSWGGFLNLHLLAVEKRIKASSVIYSSAFISDSEWGRARIKEGTREDYDKYIDPRGNLAKITCPVLFTAGTNDHAFTMNNRIRTAESLSGNVYYALRENFPHGNFYGFEQRESSSFFEKILDGIQIPQPVIEWKNERQIYIQPHSSDMEVYLVHTEEDMTKKDMPIWKSNKVNSNQEIDIPTDCQAFFIVECENGCQWSSNVFIKRK